MLLTILPLQFVYSQALCFDQVQGCPNQDLTNYGYASNNNAATIEYDNYISAYHGTIARNTDGSLSVWGEESAFPGGAGNHNFIPTLINSTNYPGLLGTPLKATLGSDFNRHQYLVLTTEGIFVWGTADVVIDASLTTNTDIGQSYETSDFQQLEVDGNQNGLPSGVSPTNVKMFTATGGLSPSDLGTVAIVTCSGEAWVLSKSQSVNHGGSPTQWQRVSTAENTPLENVIVLRVAGNTLFALTHDNRIWTWGERTYLGNNSEMEERAYATEMTVPDGIDIKMISMTIQTSSVDEFELAYFLLGTNGALYSLGKNELRALGDWTTNERREWVQPLYQPEENGEAAAPMNNIVWIDGQQHSARRYAAINVINENGTLWTWGVNDENMLGGDIPDVPIDPQIPNDLTEDDIILGVSTGGHTSMIINACETSYGYVGHIIRGSIGDGSTNSGQEDTYTYETGDIQICGIETRADILFNPSVQDIPACSALEYTLRANIEGGTFRITEDPGNIATLQGNTLTLSAPGQVTLEYEVDSICQPDAIITEEEVNIDGCSVTVELTGGPCWRTLSSPFQNASYADLLDGLWTQGVDGANYSGGKPNVLIWNNQPGLDTENWITPDNMNNTVPAGTGFLVSVFGDDNYDGIDDGFPKTVEIVGVPYTAAVSPTINPHSSGWTLVGNPFGQTIDFDQTVRSNLTNVAYVYDRNAGGTTNDSEGGWISTDGTVGDLFDGQISAFQGFFIQNEEDDNGGSFTPQITFTDASKADDESEFYGKQSQDIHFIRLQIDGEGLQNSAWLRFSENGSNNLVKGDALQLYPFGAEYTLLGTRKAGHILDIAQYSLESEEVQIPVFFETTNHGIYEITVSDISVPEWMDLELYDTVEDVSVPINNQMKYSFYLNEASKQFTGFNLSCSISQPESLKSFEPHPVKAIAGDRFLIRSVNRLDPPDMNLPQEFSLKQNYPNPFNPTTQIEYHLPQTSQVSLTVYNLMGQRVATLINQSVPAGIHSVTFDGASLSSGVYIYRLQTESFDVSKKLLLVK